MTQFRTFLRTVWLFILLICLVERPQYPDRLTVASTGEAATVQSSRLGEYTRQSANHNYNNRPTYKHVERNTFLFYSDEGYWIIGDVANGKKGGIKCVMKQSSFR